jgi:hypothetical protein
MMGKSSLLVTGLPLESSTVPAGTINSGGFVAGGLRLGTPLTSIGVPSIFSGGISVVRGIGSAAWAVTAKAATAAIMMVDGCFFMWFGGAPR